MAITKPVFGRVEEHPGRRQRVQPEEAAATRKASATRKTRASPRRLAASPVARPSPTLTTATASTSQKWLGWWAHSASRPG